MKLTKQETEFGIDVLLKEENKAFEISFGGNLDLYWKIRSKEESDKHSFIITKENGVVYRLFETLYNDIENINIFSNDIYTEEEIKEQKNRYRKFNLSRYNDLFDKDNKTITWHSDETAYDVSNILRIKKKEDSFELEFSIQPHINGYDRDFNSPNYIPIRFRNSGSMYLPFNYLFMKMYKELIKVDDVNDYGHQMTIDEFQYKKRLVNKY